jgi:hypothetical protein
MITSSLLSHCRRCATSMGGRLLLCMALLVIVPAMGRSDANEYVFKAAILTNFARLIEWPVSSFNAPNDPIILCILDPQPFGEALSAIDGIMVQGRPLRVTVCTPLEPSLACHILFANAREDYVRLAAIRTAMDRAVLVVGETAGFARQEGMIGLFRERHRIGFEINPVRIEAAGLKVSSRLIKLGRLVIGGGGP